MSNRKGWLNKQIKETQKRVKKYPKWMRKAMRWEGGKKPNEA